MRSLSRILTPTLSLSLLLSAACADKEVEVYKVAKEAPPAVAPMAGSDRTGAHNHDHDHDHDHDHSGGKPAAELRWSAPKDWRQQPASGMRFASFQIPAGGGNNVDFSVVVLEGSAGGDLANVNRWRGQIGLNPINEKELAGSSERIKSMAGTLRCFDFTGEGSPGGKSRLLAAILPRNGKTWFFKATGTEKEVEQAKPSYRRFLESLR